jgi:O-antigen/teichoic acid export membrane protein
MDIGLGNGMRNKLAESIALDNRQLAKEYVSTTYIIFSFILALIIIIFSIINCFLNWNSILNTNLAHNQLLLVSFVIVFSFCLRLLLSLALSVAMAAQKVYLDSLLGFIINFTTLVVVYFLPYLNKPSFLIFSCTLTVIPIFILIIFNFIFFKFSSLRFLSPSVKYYNKFHFENLFNIGIQFFIIQIVVIVIFSTDNILISHFFSSSDVTAFNIAYKYFSISTIGFSIILLPYWNAFTSAYVKNDLLWIKHAFKKLLLIWLLQAFGVIILLMLANLIFKIWVGDKVHIPISISITLAIYSILYNWNNIFAYFLNGVSKIRLQLFSAIFIGIINIPLTYALVKFTKLGLSSIVISNIICILIGSIWSPIQCFKIINNKANGIWNK